jgi:hypothetical protein
MVAVSDPRDFDLSKLESQSFASFCILASLAILALPAIAAARSKAVESRVKLRFLLAATAFVPWFVTILLVAGENDDTIGRRFIWLWVVQGALMALFVLNVARRPIVRVLAATGLILIIVANGYFVGMTVNGYKSRFHALPANDFNNAVDFVGRRLKTEGRVSASIGYDVPFDRWMISERAVDGVSKVGRVYDAVLQTRHGITNLDTNAEGVSRDDEFRIVEHPATVAWGRLYFDLSGYPDMPIVYSSPTYTVLSRSAGANVR